MSTHVTGDRKYPNYEARTVSSRVRHSDRWVLQSVSQRGENSRQETIFRLTDIVVTLPSDDWGSLGCQFKMLQKHQHQQGKSTR